MSQQTIDWTVLNELLPTEKSSGGSSDDHANDHDTDDAAQQQQQQERRRSIFTQYFDSNNNGICSLAECDKGIQELLPTFYNNHVLTRPVILRAFTAAKGIRQEEEGNRGSGEDYIEWAEFRMFLLYLKQYAALWELFEHADSSSSSSSTDQGDRRISLEEFTATVPQLMMDRFGIVIQDATTTFQQIDTNQGGHILFVEFADWAIREKLIPLHE
jgi:hypothetical protein